LVAAGGVHVLPDPVGIDQPTGNPGDFGHPGECDCRPRPVRVSMAANARRRLSWLSLVLAALSAAVRASVAVFVVIGPGRRERR
jgi:hypothetical protein